MRRCLSLIILGCLVSATLAFGDDAASPKPGPTQAASEPPKTEEAKLLTAVQEALERNAQEIKALKEQYAKDMQEQQKKVTSQQTQIETLQQTAKALEDRLKAAQAAVPNAAPGGQNPQVPADRQQKLTDIQQKQLEVLEEQLGLVANVFENLAPTVQNLQTQTATLQARSQQAARRDMELANLDNFLIEQMDAERRNGPQLPPLLKGMFAPIQTTSSPITIINTFAVRYDLFTHQRGAGLFEFQEFTPFFLVQLNKRILLSAQLVFAPAGFALGQAQADIFINDWLTMDIGYFLAPIGFYNERIDAEWINKLPDQPLVMRQVIPYGLTLTGLQFRGSKYLFDSPVKMEYSVYATNATGVPGGAGRQPGWANLDRLLGTTANLNSGMAYGGRLGFWIPARGINFGVSEFANAPYSNTAGAITSIWQPYFNYHRGNWDYRFEYGQNYERTRDFIGNSIERNGFYTQLAYRDYKSTRTHLQRLEYVLRFSDARFRGINQQGAAANVSSFPTPMDAPVDRNQYTIGVNYYLAPVTVFKIAYEINEELRYNLKDNVLFMQFATNF
jgi:hypothetical protein